MGFLPSTVSLRTEAFLFLGYFCHQSYLESKSDLNRYPATPPRWLSVKHGTQVSPTPVKETILSRCFFHLSQTGTTIFFRKKWVAHPKYPVLLLGKMMFFHPNKHAKAITQHGRFPPWLNIFCEIFQAKCEFWLVLQVYAKMRNHVTFQITIITYMIC